MFHPTTICPPEQSIVEPVPADRRWWAQFNPDWHDTEPTPLDALAIVEPFDFDAPMPDREIDQLYCERLAESFGTFGHPSWPLS